MTRGPSATETRHFRTLFSLGAAGMLTDGQLLERFAARDGDPAELAFAALVERHGSMVLRVARGVLVDEHSAHDAFQATFLILARKARSLWVRDSLGPWLHAVAFRVASHARSLEIRRKLREQDASKPEAQNDRDSDRADLIRAIHEEIDRLPEPFRQAVVTCHLEGLTQQDAATRLGWPVGTLQSRLDRGRRKLKGQLERRGLAPSLTILLGHSQAIPPALMTSTARAAAGLNLGKAITGMIAPTALALLKTTTKGMLMTKLKIGFAAVLMAVGGIVGTGIATGVGKPIRATDQPKAAVPFRLSSMPSPLPDEENQETIIPPPIDGDGFPYLLEFYSTETPAGAKLHQEISKLIGRGYPIKSYDRVVYGAANSVGRSLDNHYRIDAYPTILLVNGLGVEFARITRFTTPASVAAFYNQFRSQSALKAPQVEIKSPGPDEFRAAEDPPQARPTNVESIAQWKKAPKPEPEPLDGLPQPAEGLGFPVLLDFHASWAVPSRRMRPVITQLVTAGYPVKTVDIHRFGDLQQKYKVNAVPTFILVSLAGSNARN